MIATINQAIDAIMAWNDAPDRRHDDKWAISTNGLKSYINAQNRILEIMETRAAEIQAHHEQHGLNCCTLINNSTEVTTPHSNQASHYLSWCLIGRSCVVSCEEGFQTGDQTFEPLSIKFVSYEPVTVTPSLWTIPLA